MVSNEPRSRCCHKTAWKSKAVNLACLFVNSNLTHSREPTLKVLCVSKEAKLQNTGLKSPFLFLCCFDRSLCTKPSKQHPPKDHFTVLSTCDDHECDFMLVVMVNFKKQLLSLSFWLTTHFHDFYSHGELNSKCDVLSDSVLTEVFVVNRIKRVRKTNFSFAMRE